MADERVGYYAFIVGVIIAVILGLSTGYITDQVTAWLVSILVILGLIVGFLNVTGKETREFLEVGTILAIIAFVGGNAADLSQVLYVGSYLAGILSHILAFVVPAVVVVALKDIWKLGQP